MYVYPTYPTYSACYSSNNNSDGFGSGWIWAIIIVVIIIFFLFQQVTEEMLILTKKSTA